jgi:PilZ domain-containing protein
VKSDRLHLERRQKRRTEATREFTGQLRREDGETLPCRIFELSQEGCSVRIPMGTLRLEELGQRFSRLTFFLPSEDTPLRHEFAVHVLHARHFGAHEFALGLTFSSEKEESLARFRKCLIASGLVGGGGVVPRANRVRPRL